MRKFVLLLIALMFATGAQAQTRINGSRVIQGTVNYCADAGANDTYACNMAPAMTAYVTGTTYIVKANTANTGAATINFNSLGAKTIMKVVGGITTNLEDNDIRAGQNVFISYDGTNMQMLSHLGNAAAGGVPTTITVADTTDPSSSVALFESTTGDLAPKTDAGLTYDASTGALQAGGEAVVTANQLLDFGGVPDYEFVTSFGEAPVLTGAMPTGVPHFDTSTLVFSAVTWGTGLTFTGTTSNCDAMSTTAVGCPEAAIASEVNTGTDATRAVTPSALATSIAGQKYVEMLVSLDFTTNTATGDGQFYFYVPGDIGTAGWRVVGVAARVTTVGTTNPTTIDIAKCTTVATGSPCSGTVVDLLSTNITIDSNEFTSATATPAVIDTANDDLANGDTLRIDVDAVSTTPAKGLVVIVTLGI